MIKSKQIEVDTKGYCDVVNITDNINAFLAAEKILNGQVTVFVAGSTAGVTTIEYEKGAIKDLQEYFDRQIPKDLKYQHNEKWGDGNGFSHIRSAILGTSLVVPIFNGDIVAGTWQQIVLVDFDNKPRSRKIIIQISGK